MFKRKKDRVFYIIHDNYIKLWFNEESLFSVISRDGQTITTNTTYYPAYYDLTTQLADFIASINYLSIRSLLPTWFKQRGITAIDMSKDRQ